MSSQYIYSIHPSLSFAPSVKHFEKHNHLIDGHTALSFTEKPCTPFTYLIGWSKHGLYYYGSRYSQYCHPTNLWTTYFTSSDVVTFTVDLYGEPDIIQIRQVFDDIRTCLAFEHKVLTRLDAANNPKFLNKRNSEVSQRVCVISGKKLITNQETGESIYIQEDQLDRFPDYVLGAAVSRYSHMSDMLNAVDPITGLKESERRAALAVEKKRLSGSAVVTARIAANTRRTTIVDGKTIDQIAAEKISNTRLTKIDPVTGLTVGKAGGQKLAKTLQDIDEETGLTKLELRTRSRMTNSKNRKEVLIYNSVGELVYHIDGVINRFDPFCKEHNLPKRALYDSFMNGGEPIYVTNKLPSINTEHFKQFVGWYAIRIPFEKAGEPA